MRGKKKNCKGSLTLEAMIAFPVFIGFFILLMWLVRIVTFNIAIDHAVNETAKHLAALSYPITTLNEIEEEVFSDGLEGGIPSFKEEGERIKEYMEDAGSGIFYKALSGELSKEDIFDAVEVLAKDVKSDYISGLFKHLFNNTGSGYYEIKNHLKLKLAEDLLDKFLEGTGVSRESLDIVFVALPQSNVEYGINYRNFRETSGGTEGGYAAGGGQQEETGIYEKLGFFPGQDDVVVCVEYAPKEGTLLQNLLPNRFMPVFKFTATEKAWLAGGNGVYTVRQDSNPSDGTGGKEPGGAGGAGETGETIPETSLEEEYRKIAEETVYITRTGIKHHKIKCRYLAKSKIPIKISDAEKKGYTPCKICYGK